MLKKKKKEVKEVVKKDYLVLIAENYVDLTRKNHPRAYMTDDYYHFDYDIKKKEELFKLDKDELIKFVQENGKKSIIAIYENKVISFEVIVELGDKCAKDKR